MLPWRLLSRNLDSGPGFWMCWSCWHELLRCVCHHGGMSYFHVFWGRYFSAIRSLDVDYRCEARDAMSCVHASAPKRGARGGTLEGHVLCVIQHARRRIARTFSTPAYERRNQNEGTRTKEPEQRNRTKKAERSNWNR